MTSVFPHSSFIAPLAQPRLHRSRPRRSICPFVQPTASNAQSDRKAERRSLSQVNVPPFQQTLLEKSPAHHPLTRQAFQTLQINIGLTCNLACRHCHVESSPSRTETMPSPVADRLVHLASQAPYLRTVDITGGAPELHAEFRPLVSAFSALGLSVIDRCNLTVLALPGQEDLVPFLARHRVRVVASLPCYSAENVERQRGNGVFDTSIRALQRLNEAGYGVPSSGLELDLVYNPGDATLPPAQSSLEADYKRELKRAFNIDFSNLICIANMPIKRFADDLLQENGLQSYMDLLLSSFNAQTVSSLMCLDMIHVAWDGRFYDCDFNFALDMPLDGGAGQAFGKDSPFAQGLSVFDVESLSELKGRTIATGKHCYGCTAGNGSSCGGTLL